MISILGLAIVQHQYLRVGLKLARTQFSEKIGRSTEDIQEGLGYRNQLTYLIASALERDTTFFRTSPDSVLDASSYFLRDYLKESFLKNGVEADFNFVLKTRDAQYYLEGPEGAVEKASDVYPIPLQGYLPDTFKREFVLYIQFRPLERYFLSQLNGLIYPSLLFLTGILFTVIWALRTYYWQRHKIEATHEFLNNLTHELRTPVFSIQLATRLMQEKGVPGNDNLLTMIRTQTDRLTDHIDRVLQLSSLEKQRDAFKIQEFDLRETLQRLCSEFAELSRLENIGFTYELDRGPFWIQGDEWHLSNAISNLLDNARKYAKDPEIQLKAHREGRVLRVEVSDNGPGIDRKDRKRIFHKYVRVADGNLHPVKGYGLGLNYVQKVIRKSKGTIKVDSVLGTGTTFVLNLPIVRTHAEE